jgi:hypothetical protein
MIKYCFVNGEYVQYKFSNSKIRKRYIPTRFTWKCTLRSALSCHVDNDKAFFYDFDLSCPCF